MSKSAGCRGDLAPTLEQRYSRLAVGACAATSSEVSALLPGNLYASLHRRTARITIRFLNELVTNTLAAKLP